MGCACAINCWRHQFCIVLFWFIIIVFYGFCFGLLVGALDEIVHTQQERGILRVGKTAAAIIYIVTVIGTVCVKWLRPYQDNLTTALCRPIFFIGRTFARCLGCARGEVSLGGYDPIESSTAASTLVPSKDSSVAEMSLMASSSSQASTSGEKRQRSSSVDPEDMPRSSERDAAFLEDQVKMACEASSSVIQDASSELVIANEPESVSPPASNLRIEITASSSVEVSTEDRESCQTMSVEASGVVCASMAEDESKD